MKQKKKTDLPDIDFLELEREYCARSLSNFVKRAWHVLEPSNPYVHNWHIDAVGDHLDACATGQIKRLLINIPPGTSKSLLTNVFYPAWLWGAKQRPNTQFLGASHAEALAVRDCRKMRLLVQSEWYQSLWKLDITSDQNQKTNFENADLGWRAACAVRSMTGRRADIVVWDDPHSAEDAHSPAQLETAERVFRETLPSRLNNPKTSAIIIIMQRLADKDISGVITSGDYGYEHLCLPMEYEPDRTYHTSLGFKDPRTQAGELLFPERFPEDVVAREKNIMGSNAYAGQYQQRPSPRGGQIIKGSWFGLYTKPPVIKYRKIYADTALKTAEHNDYSVLQLWGYGSDKKIYFLDQVRGRWDAIDLERTAVSFWTKHRNADRALYGALRGIAVEDKASGTGLIQTLARRHNIPVTPIQRTKDKYTRLMDVLGYLESGFVQLPQDHQDLSSFIYECESFTATNSHAHDDQVDCLIDAVSDMLASTSNQWSLDML